MATMRRLALAVLMTMAIGCGTAEDVPWCAEDNSVAADGSTSFAEPCLDATKNSAGPCMVTYTPSGTQIPQIVQLQETGCRSTISEKYSYICTSSVATVDECVAARNGQ